MRKSGKRKERVNTNEEKDWIFDCNHDRDCFFIRLWFCTFASSCSHNGTGEYFYSDTKRGAYDNSNAYRSANKYINADSHTNADEYTYTDKYADPDKHADTNPNEYADANSGC